LKTLLVLTALFPVACFAALGDQLSTQIKSLSVQKAQESETTFRVVPEQENGVAIKEYIDANDLTFAVSWRGPRKPNLNLLLGKFVIQYAVAGAMKPIERGHRSRQISTDEIEVLHYGHWGDIRGFAYIKSKLPAGVSTGDLQ
jgi:hypothetical protein